MLFPTLASRSTLHELILDASHELKLTHKSKVEKKISLLAT